MKPASQHRPFLASIGLFAAAGSVAEETPPDPRVLDKVVVSAQKRGDQSLQGLAMTAIVMRRLLRPKERVRRVRSAAARKAG